MATSNKRVSVGYLKLPTDLSRKLNKAAGEEDRSVIRQAIHFISEGLARRDKAKSK